MFDKLKYNNLIISGSKEIQKAKIQVLRKVIQKIQKLKKLAEKRPDDESCKIKLRKCLEVVESAKKIKKFEALTNILLLEKSPNKIVTNSRSTPEEVAIAMLATNQIMKTFLTKVRQELSLNDDDLPTWRKTLVQISKQKIKTQRRKKKKLALAATGTEPAKKKSKSKKKVKKIKAANENENLESLTCIEEHNVQENNISENEAETPKLKSKQAILKSTMSETTSEDLFSQAVTKESKKSKSKNSLLVKESESMPNFRDLNKEFKKNPNKKGLDKIKTSKSESAFIANENKALNNGLKSNFHEEDSKSNISFTTKDSKTLENFKIENNSSKPTKISQPQVKVSRIVDPFFVTSTGENYVATVPEIETKIEVTETNVNFKEKKKDSFDKLKAPKTESQKLHPSWEAKQRQRTPVSFQGKRKVFNDVGDTKQPSNQKSNDSAGGDMHPSWVAKQKLKPTITAFQGKKIKFDDA